MCTKQKRNEKEKYSDPSINHVFMNLVGLVVFVGGEASSSTSIRITSSGSSCDDMGGVSGRGKGRGWWVLGD